MVGSRAARRAPSRALPRHLALWTNADRARQQGNFSCEMPRCGRSQERSNDQTPSPDALHGVDVDFADAVAILVTSIRAPTMADRFVTEAPLPETAVDRV